MGTLTAPAPWKQLLLSAMESNSHLRHSSYIQLATIGCNGRPSNRTVVFRGFQEDSDKIQIHTDCRSLDMIDGSDPDAVKLKQREKCWFSTSLRSRLQYLGPHPGLPDPSEETPAQVFLDPSAGPAAAFCVLVLDPQQVDFLNLKSNQRVTFSSTQSPNGDKCWTSERVNP
ncbi:unnamed protein product [Malus baccata var. baccata]